MLRRGPEPLRPQRLVSCRPARDAPRVHVFRHPCKRVAVTAFAVGPVVRERELAPVDKRVPGLLEAPGLESVWRNLIPENLLHAFADSEAHGGGHGHERAVEHCARDVFHPEPAARGDLDFGCRLVPELLAAEALLPETLHCRTAAFRLCLAIPPLRLVLHVIRVRLVPPAPHQQHVGPATRGVEARRGVRRQVGI
eukprot:CAMPEP_0180152422 /NCGR_PEP_ID=MMETSP0986-20121125/22780_1 /TAXON_ID=697907 /ORGANISM="non described non described, Strain CCMP2293" /LENGTH=195 /DNA_ID=CAMNT_0022100035 /DNA_START=348 /DNA_END=935 /DNA_ORIENTATION=-